MCHCQYENAMCFDAIDDAERIPSQKVPACAVIKRRPGVRKISDRYFSCVDFLAEAGRGRDTTFAIPASGGFGFFQRFLDILKGGRHVPLLSEFDGEPLPTTLSLRCQRRLDGCALGFQWTKPPLHPHQPRSRGSESTRQRGPPALQSTVATPPRAAVSSSWIQRLPPYFRTVFVRLPYEPPSIRSK